MGNGGTISGVRKGNFNELKVTSNAVSKPAIEIKNIRNDANASTLKFIKDKNGSAGADNDDIGTIEFVSDDAAQTQTTFAKILAEVSEADNNDEAGKLSFYVAASDGITTTPTVGLKLEGEHNTGGEVDVTIGGGAGSTTTIVGNLTVSGTTTTVNSTTLTIVDPLIILANGNNSSDNLDIGMYGMYDTSGAQDLYSGLFRDANDSGKWKLFKDLQEAPTTTVNTTGSGYAVGTLVANLERTTTGDAQDLTIKLLGSTDSSLVLSSTGTAADALQISTSAGGMDITVSGASAGEDLDITSNTSINLTSTESVTDSIVISSTNGGIDITAAGQDIDITATGSSLNLISTEAAADSLVISSTNGGVKVLGAGLIVACGPGGIDIDSNGAFSIETTGTASDIKITTAHTSGDAFHLDANADAASKVIIDAGILDINVTAAATIDAVGISLNAGSGALTIASAGTGLDAIKLDATAGNMLIAPNLIDRKILTIGPASTQMKFMPHDVADNEKISLINEGGDGADAIYIKALLGTLNVDANILDIDVTASSAITITSSADAEDLTISQVGAYDSSIIITAAGTGTDAIKLNASAGGMDIDASGALTIDSNTSINIGTTANKPIDINSSTLDIDASGNMTIDSATSIVIGAFHIGMNSTTLDINASDNTSLTVAGVGKTLDIDASGALTIDSATSINIGTNADKPIDIDASTLDIDASGVLTIDSATSINIGTAADKPIDIDATTLDIDASGAITISGGTISLSSGGILDIESTSVTLESSIKIKEASAAGTDTTAYGQIWVNAATPNELYFTTDAGNDIQLTSGTAIAGGGGGASALNDLSDVSYGSGDLTITSLDTITYANSENAALNITATAHNTAGKILTISGGSTTAGTTSDIAGGNLLLQGGAGKGTGAGGSIIFKSATAAGSSANSLNAINDTILTLDSDLSATFTGDVAAPSLILEAPAASGVNVLPLMTLVNTDANKDSMGQITFAKQSARGGGEDAERIGSILFESINSDGEPKPFGQIRGEISESTAGDEAGKLSFFVSESNGSESQLTAGLILEGEHATDGEVDVIIAAGAASTTTVSGDLIITSKLIMDDVTGGKILVGDDASYEEVAVSGDATLAPNGAVTIANNAVTLAKMAGLARGNIIFGDTNGDPAALGVGNNGKILVANANGDPSWTAMSSDATLSAGALTIADDAVTLAKMANITRGSIIVGGTSDAPTLLDAKTSAQILVGNGTTLVSVGVSGDVTMDNAGAVTIIGEAVEGSMLNNNAISGRAEMTGDVGDADELLISDGGTVKRADFSVVRDAVFNDVTGHAAIADGGAMTIADGAISLARMAAAAANTVIVRDVNSSGVLSAKALATTEILIGDGNGFTAAALSGDVTMTNAGVVTIGNTKVTGAMLNDNVISGQGELTGVSVEQADLLLIDDGPGTIKKVTFSNFEDSIFDNVSGDAGIAAGGALTIADDAVTLDKMANITQGSIIVGGGSAAPTLLDAKTSAQILVGDGTDLASVAVSSDATLATNGALTIADNAVTVAKMAGLTSGNIIVGNASNNPVALGVGSDGQVLTTDGSVISWGSAGGGASSLNDLNDVAMLQGTDSAGAYYFHAGPRVGTLSGANYNTGVGIQALNDLTSGDNNTAVGLDSVAELTNASGNTGIGVNALRNTNAGSNTGVGHNAGNTNTSGTSNTAIGVLAMYSNSVTNFNTCVGFSAGKNMTGAGATANNAYNVYVGANAGLSSSGTGYWNTGVGGEALTAMTSGYKNVAIGGGTDKGAGKTITTGHSNVCIGHNADASTGGAINQIVIGEGAVGLGQNQITMGNSSITTLSTHGDIVAYYSSDRRLKDNITPIESPLEKLDKIGGYTFDWIEKKEVHSNKGRDVGVIAQEIEEVLPEVVTTKENGYKAVKYEKIVPLLIECIKEQQKQIDELKKMINI